jgi:hypothetical protein
MASEKERKLEPYVAQADLPAASLLVAQMVTLCKLRL